MSSGLRNRAAGTRTVPLLPSVTRNLRLWMLQCPKADDNLLYVFPNGSGHIEYHGNIVARLWHKVQLDTGVVVTNNEDIQPKYSGLHALRHFFASWCINRTRDGGSSCRRRWCRNAWAIPRSR